MGTTTVLLPRIKEVWKLQNERGIVFLESTLGRRARVLGGTVFHAGDWVERPSGLSWGEALATDDDGHTQLSPFGLELVYDAGSRSSIRGPLPAEVSPEESRERDLIVRELLSLLHSEDEGSQAA